MASNDYTLRVLGREHIGAIGQTQTGKTTALLRFVNQLKDRAVIVVDTKHNIRIPGFILVKDWKQAVDIAKRGNKKVIYRPSTSKPPADFYQRVWDVFGSPRKPNVTLYLDEAGNLTSASQIDDKLALLVQAGKENGVGVWWAAQQSTRVHNTLLSQSEKLLIFRVTVASDRKKLENVVGKAALRAGELDTAHPEQGMGGEFMAFGFPDVEPIEAGGTVDAVYLRAN